MGNKNALYIVVIVAWSLLVHYPGIHSPLMDYHAYRQAQTSSMSRNYVRHGMHFLSPELDTSGLPQRAATEFPIYSYLLALLYKGLGVHEILGRLLSCVFAAWGALFLYGFVKPRMGSNVAFWSALAMCTLPIHVYFTRSVQPEPMALWGLLGFLYYADRWLFRDFKASSWLLAFLIGSQAPLLKLPYIYLLIPLWAFLGFEKYGWRAFLTFKWVSLVTFVVAITITWYRYTQTAPVAVLPLSRAEHLANLAPILTIRLWRAQFISRIPELVMTYSGLLLAGIGMIYFRKAKSYRFYLLWSLAAVVYVALLGEYGLIHRYTLLPLAPIAAIWIALGISTMREYAKRHPAFQIVVFILLIGIPVHSALRIRHWYKVEYLYLYRAQAKLAQISRPTDLVLVATHEMPQHLYYLDRYGYAIAPATWQPQDVDSMISKGVKFILIPLTDNEKRLPEWKAYLQNRGRLIQEDESYWLYQVGVKPATPPKAPTAKKPVKPVKSPPPSKPPKSAKPRKI